MYTLKKSLGQHFLKDENISRKIVAALDTCSFENLLEIGPGGGALTKFLVAIPDISFKAVEIDYEKADFLESTLNIAKEQIIRNSILEIPPPFHDRFAVIGNFPYNISTEILFKLIEWKAQVSCVVGMFQKEVAQRIAAPSGNKVYGITSILTQAFFQVEYLFDVSEQCFQPPPKVKSAVIRMTPRSDQLSFKSERDLFRVVKAAFNQRRKTLRNALRGLFAPAALEDPIFTKRAEQLSVEEFAALSFKILS